MRDGGSGRCFSSGHATKGFAFLTQFFLWRPFNRRRARLWLTAAMLFGLAMGALQVVRGAHYVSHVLWTAWGGLLRPVLAGRCGAVGLQPSATTGCCVTSPRRDSVQPVTRIE